MNTLEFKNYIAKLKLEYKEWVIRIAHDIYNDNICDNESHYNDDEGDISIFERYKDEVSGDKSLVDLILLCSTTTGELDGVDARTGDSHFSYYDEFSVIKQDVAIKAFFFEVSEEIDNIIDKNRKY